MFNLIGFGEHAGSGVSDIFKAWRDAGLAAPVIEEMFGGGTQDRTILTLPLAFGSGTSLGTNLGTGDEANKIRIIEFCQKPRSKAATMYSVREFGDMCLLLALDKVVDYGDTLNVPQADERNRKVTRKEVMLFNLKAFKEAVINAFQHNLWISGTAPMFTAFQDRIEITSIGTLPPHQTKEGFYAGVSIPVNDKLTEIFVQLHISEKSGRGVPRIVGEYGEKAFDFSNNSITVTIPYNRLNLGGTPQVTPPGYPPGYSFSARRFV